MNIPIINETIFSPDKISVTLNIFSKEIIEIFEDFKVLIIELGENIIEMRLIFNGEIIGNINGEIKGDQFYLNRFSTINFRNNFLDNGYLEIFFSEDINTNLIGTLKIKDLGKYLITFFIKYLQTINLKKETPITTIKFNILSGTEDIYLNIIDFLLKNNIIQGFENSSELLNNGIESTHFIIHI